MGRTSWATSARFHDSDAFQAKESLQLNKVLANYGLQSGGVEEDRTQFAVSEEIRRCKTCELMKPVSGFHHQTKVVAGAPKVYYNLECKDCKREKKGTSTTKDVESRRFNKEMADAPLVAALRLMDDHPEAVALLIKHFKPDFVKLYEAEKERVEQREKDRLAAMDSRKKV